jgi:hypothetical protein
VPTTRTERRYVSVRQLGRTHTSCLCPVSLSDQRDGHLAGRGRCRSYGRADASTAPCKTARTRFRTSAHRPHLLTLIQRPDRNESGREVQISTLLLGQRHCGRLQQHLDAAPSALERTPDVGLTGVWVLWDWSEYDDRDESAGRPSTRRLRRGPAAYSSGGGAAVTLSR